METIDPEMPEEVLPPATRTTPRTGWRQGKTKPQTLDATVRRQFVFAMRRTGATYEAIARAAHNRFRDELPVRYDKRAVHKDVTRELTAMRRDMGEDIEHVRAMELDRLDRMLVAMWPLAIGRPADLERGIPAEPPDVGAQQMVLNVMQRRARYLPGLEAPVAVAPVTPDGSQPWDPGQVFTDSFCVEVAMAMAEFGQMLGPGGRNGSTPHDDDPADDDR